MLVNNGKYVSFSRSIRERGEIDKDKMQICEKGCGSMHETNDLLLALIASGALLSFVALKACPAVWILFILLLFLHINVQIGFAECFFSKEDCLLIALVSFLLSLQVTRSLGKDI
jgi:hypothetical protein